MRLFLFCFGRRSELPGVIAVVPDTLYKPLTTHSWDFLGLASNGHITPAWASAGLGVDTIIGAIDTGKVVVSPLTDFDFFLTSIRSTSTSYGASCDIGSMHVLRKAYGRNP